MPRLTSPTQTNHRLEELRQQRRAVDCLIRALDRYQRVHGKMTAERAKTLHGGEGWQRRLAS